MKNKIITVTTGVLLVVFGVCFAFAGEGEVSEPTDPSEPPEQQSIVFDMIEITGEHTDEGIYYGDVKIGYSLQGDEGIKAVELIYADKVIDSHNYTKDENGEEIEDLVAEAKGEFEIDAAFLADNESENYEYVFLLRALDGKDINAEKEIVLKADASVPQIKIKGVNENGIYKDDKSIEISADDKNLDNALMSVVIRHNGEEVENKKDLPAKDGYSFTLKTDGEYEITAAIKDKGNHEVAVSKQFILDKTKPDITDVTLTGDQNAGSTWYCGDINISAAVEDKMSGIASILVKINGEPIEKVNTPGELQEIDIDLSAEKIGLIKSEDGAYDLEIIAEDLAGNKNTVSKSFHADSVAPNVEISGIRQGTYTNKKPVITIKSDDKYAKQGIITVIIMRDGVEIDRFDKKGSKAEVSDFKSDGSYEIKAVAKDAAGNASDEETISFVYDTAAPQIGGIDVAGMKREGFDWYYDSVTYNSESSDTLAGIKEITLSVNDIEIVSHKPEGEKTDRISGSLVKEWFMKNESKTGEYKIKITAEDLAGNKNTVSKSIKADVTKPEISLSGIPEGEFTSKSPTISAAVNDNHKGKNTINCNVALDNEDYKNTAHEGAAYKFDKFDKDGKYIITVTATDLAGNKSEAAVLSFTKDTVAPQLSLTGAKEGSYTQGAKTISAKVVERNYANMTVNCDIVRDLDGKKNKIEFAVKPDKLNYVKSKTVNGTGTYTVTITAEDKAGNKAKAKKLVFTIDNDPPTVEISDIADINGYDSVVAPQITYEDSYYESREISLTRASGKAIDIKGIHFFEDETDRGGVLKYDDFAKEAAFDDIYTLTCRVIDKAGNETTEEKTFYVNRFGSKFDLADKAKASNGAYVKNVDDDIVLKERSVTGINTGKGSITKDGITRDAAISPEAISKAGFTEYVYTFGKSAFAEEGVYSINAVSKDKAGNINEYGRNNDWKIYVDRTPPVISVSGIEDNGSYNTARKRMDLTVSDGFNLESYKVTCDDQEIYNSKDKAAAEGAVSVYIPTGLNQDIKILASDAAGNTRALEISNVTVSGNFFARAFANKPLFYGFCIAAIILIGGGIAFWKKIRAKRIAEEK